MTREISVYPNVEDKKEYFVEGATGEGSALMYLESEYPEVKGKFEQRDARQVPMAMCLDCESYWVDEEGVCGECGEYRLSKRHKMVYWFRKRK